MQRSSTAVAAANGGMFRPSSAPASDLLSPPTLPSEGVTLSAKPSAFAGAVLSPNHARNLTPSLCVAISSALAEQCHRRMVVPYTLWITEAWRVLCWAEPSAALFWEMATMYHTLYLAGRAFAADYEDNNGERTHSNIPPILSCGSASSVGSGTTAHTPVTFDKKKLSTVASAKELPVWLVGTFLLLHCEEFAYQRNLSGHDERRFFGGSGEVGQAAGVDFTSLLRNPSLSPRTRLHAGWNNDNSHCTAYVLRHLRKILLLSAIPHNHEAVLACIHLASLPSRPPAPPSNDRMLRRTSSRQNKYSAEELRRQHDEEHGHAGVNVQLTLDDLERLNLTLQPPQGGGIDDPPLRMGEFLWLSLKLTRPPPMATLRLGDVEREIRRHLEMELLMSDGPDDEDHSEAPPEEEATAALAKLSLNSESSKERAKQPGNQYLKELSYTSLRGTTILLKPNPAEAPSGASAASGDAHNFVGNLASAQRLHDLVISECSDAHFYLLQPFEHATISACTGCTIVVGAVAGLLHVVDCEKTVITSAARRILVSNSSDATLNIFSPSPPLLVGDNRTCQFAPYNTYYDGLREDLLATGLAAAVVPPVDQSPVGGREDQVAWPPLQCASNKWKQPVEMSKLEMPQVPNSTNASPPASPSAHSGVGADDKVHPGSGNDAAVQGPVLVPSSDFQLLFVPIESDGARQRRLEAEEAEANADGTASMESQYCRLMTEVLQMSPFRLPLEYERRVIVKAERMRNIQQAVRKSLTPEQQRRFEEDLNRGFREWLVTSGNLRQVLDLVHLERRGAL